MCLGFLGLSKFIPTKTARKLENFIEKSLGFFRFFVFFQPKLPETPALHGFRNNGKQKAFSEKGAWMSQEVSKWLVSGL